MFPNLGAAPSHAGGLRDEPPTRMACTLCKRRKLRCNRQLPCASCTRLGFDCVYGAFKSPNPSRKHRIQKSESPSARSPYTTGSSSTMGTHHRVAAKRASNQASPGTEWSVGQLKLEEMVEMEQIFFRTAHESIPILHQYRYTTAVTLEPRLRPPIYLRYILCALGAQVSSTYAGYHDALYRAARSTMEENELNDQGSESVSLARPQTWILIAVYELLNMHFQRWWLSTARAVRLCQMMGLHLIDGSRPAKRLLILAKDWVEVEEQRRTFWMAFTLDRHAAFAHRCPVIIDEKDVYTHLPVAEGAYQDSVETESMTLGRALDPQSMANLPPLAATIVLTAKVGIRLRVLRQRDMAKHGQPATEDFWQKISWLDDTLHYAFSIPPHLAASGYKHTPVLTFLHLSAPSATILLHQAAEERASSHCITPSSLLESQALRLAAAEMVVSTMRLASHIDVQLLHPFTGPCLFLAARVLLQALTVRTDEGQQKSLKYLLDLIGQLQAANPFSGGYFKELDAEFPGMRKALYAQFYANEGSGEHFFSIPGTSSPSTSVTGSYEPTPPLAPARAPEFSFVEGLNVDHMRSDIGAPALDLATTAEGTRGLYVMSTEAGTQGFNVVTTDAGLQNVYAVTNTPVGREFDDDRFQDMEEHHGLFFEEQDFFSQR